MQKNTPNLLAVLVATWPHQHRAHCLMDHIQGFTRSHWMPSLGKCLRRIAPVAAMVINFEWNKKALTKHNFLLAYLR
jgi:hypothetical protein